MKRILGILARLHAAYGNTAFLAGAAVFFTAAILLTLDGLLPYPSPSNRLLYAPKGWSFLFPAKALAPIREAPSAQARTGATGGASMGLPQLTFLTYHAKEGDTFTAIADRFHMNLDTIASLNRTAGKGVHEVRIGEEVRIPSMDGIYVAVPGDLDAFCRKYGLPTEVVLHVNAMDRASVKAGTRLFLPGVQHTGDELAISTGSGFLNPLQWGWISSNFGWRSDPFTGEQRYHLGLDIAAGIGEGVRTAMGGRVIEVDYNDVLGNYVRIAASGKYTFTYGHMSRVYARLGSIVSQGTVIGAVGATGKVTGPHLHFEVWENGIAVNPRSFLYGLR